MKTSEFLELVLESIEVRKEFWDQENFFICIRLQVIERELYDSAQIITENNIRKIKTKMIGYIGRVDSLPEEPSLYQWHLIRQLRKHPPLRFINFCRTKLLEELIIQFKKEGD